MNVELDILKNEIIKMKLDIVWLKRIGYYISGIMTIQLLATLTGKL